MMRVNEITRIVVLAVIVAFMMFVLQPLPYIRGLISLSDVPEPESWVSDYYMKGALIVFCASAIAALIWLLFAATSKGHKGRDVNKSQPIWWIIGLIPLIGIGFAIGPYKGSNDALISLSFFYVIDVLILYWLTTATSTPGSLMYIPPFSYIMRGLIGDK